MNCPNDTQPYMNRRAILRTASASVLAGTTVLTPVAAGDEDGEPKVVSVEPKRSRLAESRDDEYTVEHVGDGIVEIDVYVTVSDSCVEVEVDEITQTEDEDIVELQLVDGAATGELCLPATFERHYVIELEYESEDAVNDVAVQVSDGVSR